MKKKICMVISSYTIIMDDLIVGSSNLLDIFMLIVSYRKAFHPPNGNCTTVVTGTTVAVSWNNVVDLKF
jgi:hypothetical protein